MSTILIVEDSAIISQPIAAALKREGYETAVAEHGVAAEASISRERPDLILLDLAMPVMDGMTFLKRLRGSKATQTIPVIVLSAVADKPRVVQAVKLGISGYLLKSRFSLSEMLELIERTLSDQSAVGPQPSAVSDQPSDLSPSPPAQSQPPTAECRQPDAATTDTVRTTLPSPSQLTGVDPSEALKNLKPIMPRSELTERIESCEELKGMSPAIAQVLKLTSNARCSIEQVAKAISQDHAIALKVLKLANSSVYTRGEPVDSVQMAVTRIGLGQIRQTVLNLSVIDRYNATGGCSTIDVGQFWEHAIATGLIAAEITHARDEKETDSAFTMGLLHDIGRLYFAEQFGEAYTEIMRVANELQTPLEQVESRMLLYSHAEIMDRLLHSWHFPKQLINPIVFHHLSAGNMRRNAPRQIEETATLGLANRLAHAMMLGTSGNETIYPTGELCTLLRLDPKVIQRVQEATREECDKVKFALLANTNQALWQPLRDQYRERIGAPFRPIYASVEPQYDAYRIFCDELRTPVHDDEEDPKPNIGVIHLTSVRERVQLTTNYKSAEEKAGVDRLPLIILSPAGKIVPENSLLTNRAHEVLPAPLTVSRFLAAAQKLLSADQSMQQAA
jgi:HD-like signal output (HDOD) protein/DNA-binding NarL/FixJ family response regulator